jgi:hypothetical protein
VQDWLTCNDYVSNWHRANLAQIQDSVLNFGGPARRSLVFFDETRVFAIVLAVIGAMLLSFGAQLQNDVVTRDAVVGRKGSLRVSQLLALAKEPKWLLGTSFLGLAIIFQLGSLTLAPLIVVQPIGVLALIITSLLNARIYRVRLNPMTILSILLTMTGVGAFVGFAAGSAVEGEMSDAKLLLVVGILLLMILMFAGLFYISKGKVGPLNYIFGAGVLYGFVASLAKVVILRIGQGDWDWLTLVAVVALIGATFLGGWFVQNAYASGPPDLVIAGLTVVDPAVAVGIGILILGEASEASLTQVLGFAGSGIVAAAGVILLARVHPQLSKQEG